MADNEEVTKSFMENHWSEIKVGLIVCAIWFVGGEPLTKFVGSKLADFIGLFSSVYVELMYVHIGDGLTDRHSQDLYRIVFPFFLMALLCIPSYAHRIRNELDKAIAESERFLKTELEECVVPSPVVIEEEHASHLANLRSRASETLNKMCLMRRKFAVLIWVTWICLALSFAVFITQTYQTSYLTSAVVYIERSIEILAPVIDPNERLKLRASFRSVGSRKEFIALHEKLISTAKANSVEIPKFDPI